jgi:putative transposase
MEGHKTTGWNARLCKSPHQGASQAAQVAARGLWLAPPCPQGTSGGQETARAGGLRGAASRRGCNRQPRGLNWQKTGRRKPRPLKGSGEAAFLLGFSPSPSLAHVLKICYSFSMNTTHTPLDYQRDEHRVHLIVYHLIWCPKRRKSVLVGTLARRCQDLLEQKCQERGWQILTLAIQPDHIHLFVRVWPSDSAAGVVKECKGITSLHLRKEFPALKSVPSLWTRSYFASTADNVSQEMIQRYIEAQKGR